MPVPPTPPLDTTITPGQLGHIADHEAIAAALNSDTASLSANNTYVGTQTFGDDVFFANGKALLWRNAANSGDTYTLFVTASDQVILAALADIRLTTLGASADIVTDHSGGDGIFITDSPALVGDATYGFGGVLALDDRLGVTGVVKLQSPAARTVTDGVTTNSDPTVTSATAAFTISDKGRPISGTGIPAGSYIGVVNSATSIELSSSFATNTPVNASASGSGVSITIGVIPPVVRFVDARSSGKTWQVGADYSNNNGNFAIYQTTDRNTPDVAVRGSDGAVLLRSGANILDFGGGGAGMGLNGSNAFDVKGGSAGFRVTNNAYNAVNVAVTDAGDVSIGRGAPAAGATTGFPYIPVTAGAPSGTPTGVGGFVPVRFDSTNHKLWVYDGGWIGVVLA